MTFSLITDFKQAKKQCDRETRLLSEQLKKALMGSSAPHPIALWKPKEWENPSGYNCYNFALNTKEARRMGIPGAFSPEKDEHREMWEKTDQYHGRQHRAALRDGLIFLGSSFSRAAQQALNPAALFIRSNPENDFHWAALRRDEKSDKLFWAFIPGMDHKPRRVHFWQSIFDFSQKNEYRYFAGYYGVPQKTFKSYTEEKGYMIIPRFY